MIRRRKKALLCAIAVVLSSAAARAADPPKPYTVEDGRVDAGTFHGYQLYGKFCQHCHMPDALGQEYPYTPALAQSLKTMSERTFKSTVINGRQCGEPLVMPAFGAEPEVVQRLDDLYAYLKARADGALGRGQPARLGEGKH